VPPAPPAPLPEEADVDAEVDVGASPPVPEDVDAVELPPPEVESPNEPSQPSSIIAGNARCRKPRVHLGPANNPVVTSWLMVLSKEGISTDARPAPSKGHQAGASATKNGFAA
jgi:hypothetical protein